MKKFILTFVFVIVATLAAMAQQISVVSTTGATTLYRTLQDAIEGASNGSVIYLPGGGFSIADSVKITKKLTIIGIGHKMNNDNVDGSTTINGNLWFNDGSSGSAVMGCYMTGSVIVGDDYSAVNDILIRYCNLKSVQVKNNLCMETVVNQNYIREGSSWGNSPAKITNNIIHSIAYVDGGLIQNNIIIGYYCTHNDFNRADYDVFRIIEASNSHINNNVMIGIRTNKYGNNAHVGGSNNQVYTNMAKEMVDFTKNQILSQAGTAMLAQANQQGQMVLSLLR